MLAEFNILFFADNVQLDKERVIESANSIYNRIVDVLRNCANITVPSRKKSFYKFWWCEELDCLKQQSIDDYRLWKAMGKPRSGEVFDKSRASRLLYKQRIREFQRHESSSYTNDLHESYCLKTVPISGVVGELSLKLRA